MSSAVWSWGPTITSPSRSARECSSPGCALSCGARRKSGATTAPFSRSASCASIQPVAIDLRFIIAVLKINNDLERVGDQALNIVLHGLNVEGVSPQELRHLEGMAGKAQAMLGKSLDALVNMDQETAQAVCRMDDEVDRYNREMYDRVKEELRVHPQRSHSLIHLLMISHNLERIGDLATNIAEDVIYMVEGRIIRHGGRAENSP